VFLDRKTVRIAMTGAALSFGLALVAKPDPAAAQARLEARYTAYLAGLPLGKGAWVIEIGDSQFLAAASGMTTGLVRVFAAGDGTGFSRGAVVAHQFVPSAYAATISAGHKTEEVRMALAGGNVKEFDISPHTPPDPDRIPVTEAHRRGVLDPMTASLVYVGGTGDLLTPEVCQRHLAIFDGRLRYDLSFAYKRMEKVKAEKGYEGPALVCSVYFSPLAGHIPDRAAIKYLAKQRDMEVWLVPVAGTRVLVPFRFSLPTPLGPGVLEATEFVAVPMPTRASITKTQ
jgi:hypothetical protein